MTFRKVRRGWYTIEVISVEEAIENMTNTLSVDVSRRNAYGPDWVVSTRDNFELKNNEMGETGYITDFRTARAAKAFAKDYVKFLKGMGPKPKSFKYAHLE